MRFSVDEMDYTAKHHINRGSEEGGGDENEDGLDYIGADLPIRGLVRGDYTAHVAYCFHCKDGQLSFCLNSSCVGVEAWGFCLRRRNTY